MCRREDRFHRHDDLNKLPAHVPDDAIFLFDAIYECFETIYSIIDDFSGYVTNISSGKGPSVWIALRYWSLFISEPNIALVLFGIFRIILKFWLSRLIMITKWVSKSQEIASIPASLLALSTSVLLNIKISITGFMGPYVGFFSDDKTNLIKASRLMIFTCMPHGPKTFVNRCHCWRPITAPQEHKRARVSFCFCSGHRSSDLQLASTQGILMSWVSRGDVRPKTFDFVDQDQMT